MNQPKNWTEAQQYCRKNFTDLATVASSEETDRIVAKANGYNSTVWIGLRKSWRWSVDGSELNYKKWETSQPGNEKSEENCAIMTNDGIWFDTQCSSKHAFLCFIGRKKHIS